MSRAPSRRSLLLGGTSAAVAAPLPFRDAAPSGSGGAAPRRTDGGEAAVTTGAASAAAADWRMLRGRKVGVISNPTGILPDARHIVDSMADHDELDVVGVFGPEHGFRGSAQAGHSEPEFKDPRTGLTVYDAYGADTAKMARLLRKAGADTVVFDVQDVGVRFYTYIWTMYQAMVAARDVGAHFVVLDRPNPLGRRADGPLLSRAYASGVGLKPIIQQHGLTVGELARYFNGELLPGEGKGESEGKDKGGRVSLEVVPMHGWSPWLPVQDQEGGLPWVPPSPNMPFPDTASAYAGTGYFEGTNLSEGRGSPRPFEFVGAPYLDYRFSDRLNSRRLPGVRFRECYYVPTFDKYEGRTCAGVQLQITDPGSFRPVPTAVAMLAEARAYDGFAWRKDDADRKRPYWIDKLSGSSRLRHMLDDGASVAEVTAAWRGEVEDFEAKRRQYLLY